MDKNIELKLKAHYLELLTRGANLSEICDAISSDAGIPIALVLPTRTMIARSRSFTQELVDDYVKGLDLTPPAEVDDIYKNATESLRCKKPIVGTFPYFRYKQILCGCFSKNNMLAVFHCPIVAMVSVSEATEVLSIAAPIMATAMQLNGYITANTYHSMQTYLTSVLNGDAHDFYQQNSTFGLAIDSTDEWQILRICPDDETQLPELQDFVNQFCAVREKLWCTELEQCVIVLIDSALKEKIYKLQEQCPVACRITVSEPFHKLQNIQMALAPCHMAVKIAQFEENQEKIIFVQKYKLPIYILCNCTSDNESQWMDPTLEKIKKYDEKHKSEYFPTLRAYLLCHQSHSAMAAHLHIHKNTVLYRMQRISELFDLDLSDCRTISGLYISLFADLLP
ncbi:MAG: helix-turn-helix domain-containing protein [Lachnospiraceae bacterium]|nr:helix-turn-helix domain-containing protein [Lachnospiraceae bacterium]